MGYKVSAKFSNLLCLVLLLFLPALFPPQTEAVEITEISNAERGYQQYLALFREDPDDIDVNLGLARAAIAAGRPHQSVMAYERLLAKYPDDPSLWRELAVVYTSIEDADMAQSCLNNAGRDTDSRWRRASRFRLGFFYDSNVNEAAGASVFQIANQTVILPDQEEISSPGLSFSGHTDVSYRLSEGGAWHLTGGLGFNLQLATNSDLQEIDQMFSQWYRAFVGLRRLTATDLFEVRAVFELSDYDFYDSIYSYGAEVIFVHVVNPSLQIVTRAGLFDRRYIRNMGETGAYWYIEQSARFLFGSGRHGFTAGGRWLVADARSNRYSYDGWEAFASFNFKLNNDFELVPNVMYREKRYDAPAMNIELDDRRDNRTDLGLGLIRRLNETTDLELTYRYTVNSSNSPPYAYNKHLLGLSVVWTF